MDRSLSIIIPVFEESVENLDSIRNWILEQENSFGSIEWILSIASTKQTIEHLKESKLNHPQIVSHQDTKNSIPSPLFALDQVKNIYITVSKSGRAKQMNHGAKLATGKTLLFLHSDTRLGEGWQEQFTNSKGARWGAFKPSIDANGLIIRLAEIWGHLRTKLLHLPYGDQSIFLDRQLFEKIGGFDESIEFMEDLDLAKRLIRVTGKPVIMSQVAITSGRAWRSKQSTGILCQLGQSSRNFIAFLAFQAGIDREQILKWYKR